MLESTSKNAPPAEKFYPSLLKLETQALSTSASRNDNPIQADDFGLLVQVITVISSLAADPAALRV